MTQELIDAIKAQGRKHTDLNWYYKAINGGYKINDEQEQMLNSIEEKYSYDCQLLHDPKKVDYGVVHKELMEAIPEMQYKHRMEHSYNQGVEAALTWVMAVNEFGLEKANEEYPIHEYMELDHM